VLQLLSSIAFSQRVTPADSGLWLPHWRARAVALDLLELDSLRHERPLLTRRIELLELHRHQAAQRAMADSQLLIVKQLQLGNMQQQFDVQGQITEVYHKRYLAMKRQRNVVIVSATAVTAAIVTRIILKSAHPP
jgi:hypothetical protein